MFWNSTYYIVLHEKFTRSKLYRRKIVAKCAQYGVLEPPAMWCLIYWTRVPAAECSHLLIQHLLNWCHPKRSSWLLLKTWTALQLYPNRQAYTCCFHILCYTTSGNGTVVGKQIRHVIGRWSWNYHFFHVKHIIEGQIN